MTVSRNDRRVRLGAVLALLLLVGCATSRPAMPAQSAPLPLETPAGPSRLEHSGTSMESVLMLQLAIERAGPRLARWGPFDEPVTVRMHPDHDTLEQVVERSGYEWLRAWARYDVIDVQAPTTWGLSGARQDDVDELLLHELTHCLMYQIASDQRGWRSKRIPLWFREGMASYTAEQAYRWPTLEHLAHYLEKNPKRNPVLKPEALYREEASIVYGAAHHAFTFLVQRYGEDTVRALLREMSRGPTFPEAFATTVGLPLEAFQRDFTRFVRWRGFKGGRLLRPPGG